MTRGLVMVITSSIDETASYIIKTYSNEAEFFRVDVDRFDQYTFSVTEEDWQITSSTGTVFGNQVQSIYYRKPMLPDLRMFEPRYHAMIQRDIISLINGIADSFPGVVLTKPSVLRKTENKIFQLICAKKYGFQIPQSYIGNSNQVCMDFSMCESIIKPVSTGKTYGTDGCEIYQTNLFHDFRDDVSLTPVYLQSYVPKAYEVRVTIIGKDVYPIRIDTQNRIDWRTDYQNHQYSEIPIPNAIVHKCFQLMEDFSLAFGAFDFIVTPDGQWVFLEVNPNGQWLWLELSLGLTISEKIIRYLLRQPK